MPCHDSFTDLLSPVLETVSFSKGALLLHALAIADARSTLDIDLLGRCSNAPPALQSLMVAAIKQPVEPDGLEFHAETITISPIAQEADYEGRRITFRGNLGNIRIPMQIDIGFSDTMVPPPARITISSQLGYATSQMPGYAPETVVAEKAHAILHLGMLNSRMKDFYDIRLLFRSVAMSEASLVAALVATFSQRQTNIDLATSVVFTSSYLDDAAKQAQWSAFIRKQRRDGSRETFAEVAQEVLALLKPRLELAAKQLAVTRKPPA